MTEPVLVTDLSPESVDAMAEKLRTELSAMGFNDESPLGKPIAETILTSLGITAGKRGRK